MRIVAPMLCSLFLILCHPAAAASEHGAASRTPAADCPQSGAPDWRCSEAVSASFDSQSRLWLAYVVGQHLWLSYSSDLGQHFSAPIPVNAEPEAIAARGENRPQLIVAGERLMLSWSRPGPQRFTADIRFTYSDDGGAHFSPVQTLNRDSSGAAPTVAHSFNQMLLTADGRLQVFWLDGRERAAAQAAGDHFSGSSVFYAESLDFGQHFGREQVLSQHSCECCRLAAVASHTQDQQWLMWRAIDTNSGARDHRLAQLNAQGVKQEQAFSEEQWLIDACPHHGPDLDLQTLASDSNERLHAVWFSAGDPQASLWYRYQQAQTNSPAMPFGNPKQQAAHPQVQSLGSHLVRSWQEYTGEALQIYTQSSKDGGRQWSAPRLEMETAAAADYTFLLSDGRAIYLSWLTQAQGYRLQQVQAQQG